jgi:3-oxoacyl-[acyl-carrier protein] reductase
MVFGASGSIGQAICAHFKEQNYSVIKVRRKDSIEQENDPIFTVTWNAKSRQFSKNLATQIGKTKIDAVVWAQGINFNDDINTFDLNKHLQMYEANVTFILSTLDFLLKGDLLATSARLCIISSIWQNIARQNKLSYSITKSALQGLVQSLSIEMGQQGRLINAVLPGPLDTAMTRANLSESQISGLESMTPMRSLPALTDVTGLVSFLCSSQNTGITGQFIAADRGFSNARIL